MSGSEGLTITLAVGPPLIAGAASYALARRAARATADTTRIQVDAQAYDRAREIYESAINQLGENLRSASHRLIEADTELKQLRECKDRLDVVEDALRQTRRELATAKDDLAGLRAENTRLAVQIAHWRDNTAPG